MTTTNQILQILESAPIAAPDPLTCYREGLRISADNWYRGGKTANTTMRSAVYGALANACGPNGARLVNAVVKALFDVEGFNALVGCEILALFHWVRPFKDGAQWRTEVSAVYECVERVRGMA